MLPRGLGSAALLSALLVTSCVDGDARTDPVRTVELEPAALVFPKPGETKSAAVTVLDVDGDPTEATLRAAASPTSVALASIDGSSVRVEGESPGAATVTVTAEAPESSDGSAPPAAVAAAAERDSPSATLEVEVRGAVFGTVRYRFGEPGVPFSGATVHLFDGGGRHLRTIQPSGTFDFPNLEPGQFTVEVELPEHFVLEGDPVQTVTLSGSNPMPTVHFVVDPIPRSLEVEPASAEVGLGFESGLRAVVRDDRGKVIPHEDDPEHAAAWSADDPSTVSASGSGMEGTIFGAALGTTTVTASIEALDLSGSAEVTVVQSEEVPLDISPDEVEKLPGGTQQFQILSGPPGPYVWSVNGTVGGGATFGTITTEGFYTAPETVPTPSSFPVCARVQADPNVSACATVTIDPIPTAGEDVVVFNDINVFDETGMTAGAGDPNNQIMVENLVTYSGDGPRATGSAVWFDRGRNLKCAGTGECSDSRMSTMRSVIQDAGFTITGVTSSSGWYASNSIPSEVKVLFLWNPRVAFTWEEINAFKQFAAEGGRIVFIGEYEGYYGVGIDVENAFLTSMGAEMENIGNAVECGYRDLSGSVLRSHQVTGGMTAVRVACASVIVPGPNDFPLFYDSSNTKVLAGVAKIDVTPLSGPVAAPALARTETFQVKPLGDQEAAETETRLDAAGRPIGN